MLGATASPSRKKVPFLTEYRSTKMFIRAAKINHNESFKDSSYSIAT